MELTNKEMSQVEGGATWAWISGVAAAVVYLIGCISGYTNPSKCQN